MERDDLTVRPGLVIPASELGWSVSRSGGPGGQNVNKLSTRVSVRWSIAGSAVLGDVWRARLLDKLAPRLTKQGELIVHADGSRSQLDNQREATQRLAEIVRKPHEFAFRPIFRAMLRRRRDRNSALLLRLSAALFAFFGDDLRLDAEFHLVVLDDAVLVVILVGLFTQAVGLTLGFFLRLFTLLAFS